MKQDGPVRSGGVRHGYKEARAAGVPFRAPSSSSAMNLKIFLSKRPHLQSDTEALIKNGKRADAVIEIFRERGDGEKFYVMFFKGVEHSEWDCEFYSDDEGGLLKQIELRLRTGLSSWAELWEFSGNEWVRKKEVMT
jgi:hypothetical protein